MEEQLPLLSAEKLNDIRIMNDLVERLSQWNDGKMWILLTSRILYYFGGFAALRPVERHSLVWRLVK